MINRVIELTEIKHALTNLSPNKLAEVHEFIRQLDTSAQGNQPTIRPLKGIWKGRGFEKIDNLEDQVRSLRDEASQLSMNRSTNWNS